MARKTGKPTIVDVARAAGTSVSSVSVALRGEPGVSEQTRLRILDAAQRLGYRPDQRARLLREQQSRLLGVTFAVNQTFQAEVIDNLYRAADRCGYDLLLSATTPTRSASEAVDDLLRDRCETLILISPALDESQLADLSTRASVVTIGSELRVGAVDSVHSDDRQGVTDVVDHLVGLGHRHITYVDGGTTAMAAVRRAAYLEAMRTRGLGEHARVLSGDSTEESGIAAATRILDSGEPLPTAICTHNDMMAFGLLHTLRSRGIAVPDDISVVGFDNTRMAALATVQLTSVSQDAAQLARTAVERAIRRAENPAPGEEIVTPARLVIRETSGPPRPE
ncbi:LacI family transcriptional regulator [Saccharopolyspora subtropica]|uniref:LacI family transcriptional regulator n=1 Tax=Saccharopolyspora thermophila TaxID=89367 RepID=A0A917K6I5_9PSEU|nr:LacI family DNA-binding transcriptional regulator [Saccharopolyspora subtropica]GGJ01851.1 LacI family transcriptional regulator [Saccharopolyspora subtropica]